MRVHGEKQNVSLKPTLCLSLLIEARRHSDEDGGARIEVHRVVGDENGAELLGTRQRVEEGVEPFRRDAEEHDRAALAAGLVHLDDEVLAGVELVVGRDVDGLDSPEIGVIRLLERSDAGGGGIDLALGAVVGAVAQDYGQGFGHRYLRICCFAGITSSNRPLLEAES